jgi:ferredoxin-type protein NapH
MTKLRLVRAATASVVTLVVLRGVVAGDFRYGGLCTVGVGEIWASCPLGFLERSLAARELLPQWASVALVVVLVILLGRVFCAWGCPVVPLRRVFGDNGGLDSRRVAAPRRSGLESYSPYAVLGGTLLASFLFGFPVFCLFCPIGLSFGALYAAIRFFSPDPLGWELVVFPAVLVLELWVLKSWCRSICPVGALLSIFGNLNRFFVPATNQEKCLNSKGANCSICERVCPEKIAIAKIRSRFSPNSCTKCLECYDKCPKGAIELPVLK